MEGAQPAIDAHGLVKAFGRRKALDDVSFQLPQGAFLTVFGANGAGKTTLLRLLATLARPTSGSVSVMGADLAEEPEQVRARIGLISHEPMLYRDLCAQDNLLFCARLYGVPDPKRRVDELLEAVELGHRRFDAVGTFSRGMTQRLAVARALVHDPDVVLLDEPYSGLDAHAACALDGLLEHLRADRTFVMVEHDLSHGWELCSHYLLLDAGHVAGFGARDGLSYEEFSTRVAGMFSGKVA